MMTKEHFMYLSIALGIATIYMYNEKQKLLKSLKGVAGLPSDVQAAVTKATS